MKENKKVKRNSKKIKSGCVLSVFVLCILLTTGGCTTSLEDRLVSDNQAAFSMKLTPVEWTNKIDRLLMPLLNDGETYMSHHLDIVKDKYPTESEIAMVENTINKTQKTIEEVQKLTEPYGYSEHKTDVLKKLKMYKTALEQYGSALKEGDKDTIKLRADNLKNEFATLKTTYQVYN